MIPLADRFRLPIGQRTSGLLIAIIVVLLAGLAVAATEPGDLGDDDGARTAAEMTTTTEDGATATTEADEPEVTPTTEGTSPSTTVAPGSGLGAEGSGSAGGEALADTGGVPLVIPGILLLALAALSRRVWAR